MTCLKLSADEIKAAPPEVRQWLEAVMTHLFSPQRTSAPPIVSVMPSRTGCDEAHVGRSQIAPDLCTGPVSTTSGGIEMSQIDITPKEAAIKQLIAERAYELWENQGRPHGCDLIHWHEAEQEIMESLEPGQTELVGSTTPSTKQRSADQTVGRVNVILTS